MDIDRIIRTCENNPSTPEKKMILTLAREVQDLRAQLEAKSSGSRSRSGGKSSGQKQQTEE